MIERNAIGVIHPPPTRPHAELCVTTVLRQPLFFVSVLAAYHYFVRKCGPAWMERRQAFDLRTIMLAYNAFQVLFNLALFLHVRIAMRDVFVWPQH